MRPTRLELCGFGPFRDRTVVDFDDVDFFALTGPTGAGKSSVIDGMCFALYGDVPRYEDRRQVGYAVTLGASEAKASLAFELDGSQYVTTRVVRRSAKGGFTTKEARLERLGLGGRSDVLAGSERELTAAVKDLLGLDFEDFTKCVVLPQGEFAQFLRARGDDRRDLLIRLLNFKIYERVGQQARVRATQAATEADAGERRLAQLASATPEAEAAAASRIADLTKLHRQVEDAQLPLEALARRAADADVRAVTAQEAVVALTQVEVPQAARQLADQRQAAQDLLAEAQRKLSEAETRRMLADEQVRDLPELGRLERALDAQEQLDECRAEIEAVDAALEKARQREAEAEIHLRDAETAVAAAEGALASARDDNIAQSLAASLEVGSPCPVCLRVVERLPHHGVTHDLQTVRQAFQDAKSSLERARVEANEAGRAHAGTEQQTRGLWERVSKLQVAIADHPDADILGQTIARVREALTAREEARRVEDDERGRLRAAEATVATVDRRLREMQSAFDRQRDALAHLAPPAALREDLLEDWTALAAWAEHEIPARQADAEQARAQAASLRGQHAAMVGQLSERCRALAVAVPAGVAERPVVLVAAVTSALDQTRRLHEEILRDMAEAQRVGQDVRRWREEQQVATELGRLLRSDHFPDWLVREAMHLLVLDASTILRELSADQYSLVVGANGDFFVVDHRNADEQRSARTLSGGETFQASLALALALSEQVRELAAEGAARLDAIFLDEGFGTLDAETLEVVAGTIENLGRSGRMVGIITHVRDLANRVPVRYEVRRGPRTSTVKRVAA